MTDFFIHPTSIIDENCSIGKGTKIWHFSHIMNGASLGNNCNVGQNVVVGCNVVIGNNVRIQNNVSVYEGVVCEDDVFLGPSVVLTNVINPRSTVSRKDQFKPTIIRKGATIGANATIVCGNEIGAYAFIGAGAVVTKNILSYALVIGNPAKQVGWMSEFGHQLEFNDKNIAFCKESGQEYLIIDNQVTRVK
jgi:UDP-2-acetamido-3-amino-2,3-dideoxy-glucuronate N-acetyltransferase